MAVDARIVDGQVGGVQQAILGLAMGLASLDQRDDSYRFLVYEDHEWLAPALGGACQAQVVGAERPTGDPDLGRALRYVVEGRGRVLPPGIPQVEGQVEAIHFMQQRGFRTRLPNIYQPHDLQHLDYPERFHPLQRAYRRLSYRAMAQQATRVAVMTSSARAGTAARLGIPQSKVIVVPWASVLPLYDDSTISRAELTRRGVPERYLLYPAQSWEHKNHLGLVRAVELLRATGLRVPIVLTGRQNAYWQVVAEEIRRLDLEDLVVSLGFVETDLLLSLYRAADALVFPSLYEGWGLPIVEALGVGLPIACSDIEPIREIAAGAAVRFDPLDPAAIAESIRLVWTDRATRKRLMTAAKARSEAFSWTTTAARFRAHYRVITGHPSIGDDLELLDAPAIV